MGIGAGGAAAIAAAGQVVSSGTNAWAQGKMNRKTRKFSEKMYDKQRAHNLADWEMQNEYNSPRAQMQRYQEAGLNPHLIYGQSHTADAVRSADTPSWNPRAPQIDFNPGAIMADYFDARQKTAQTDLIAKQQSNIDADTILKSANTAKVLADTARTEFDLNLASDLRATTLEAATANVEKTISETAVLLNRDEREAASNAQTITESIARVLNLRANTAKTADEARHIRQQIINLRKDERLKQLDIQLKEKGIQPGDPLWIRAVAQNLDGRDVKSNASLKEFGRQMGFPDSNHNYKQGPPQYKKYPSEGSPAKPAGHNWQSGPPKYKKY